MITCFETLEMVDGQFFALDLHLDRLEDCARMIGIEIPRRDSIHAALDRVRASGDGVRSRVRITSDPAGAITVVAGPMPGRSSAGQAPAVVAIDRDHPVMASSPLSGLKVNSYASRAAVLDAHPQADEVVLVNEHGDVVSGVHANVIFSDGSRLLTPPLTSGCRAGVTRELLITTLHLIGTPVHESPIDHSSLTSMIAGVVCSTGRGAQAIGALGGRDLSSTDPMLLNALEVWAAVYTDRSLWS